jgi:hypothetical protein
LRLKLEDDFAISYSHSLPPLGSPSRDLRIISEIWNTAHDELTLQIAGIAGSRYELNTSNSDQVRAVNGAELKNGKLIVTFPSSSPLVYTPHSVVVHFGSPKRTTKAATAE